MGFIEDLLSIDVVYYFIAIAVLIFIWFFWERIQQSIFKSQHWRVWQPALAYFVVNGDMKRIQECVLVENKEAISDGREILAINDLANVKFTDGTSMQVPLSRVRAQSWGALFSSWDSTRIYFVEPEFEKEQYLNIIQNQKTELITLRNENLELATASLTSTEKMSVSLGKIAKNVKPTIYPMMGNRGGSLPPMPMEE